VTPSGDFVNNISESKHAVFKCFYFILYNYNITLGFKVSRGWRRGGFDWVSQNYFVFLVVARPLLRGEVVAAVFFLGEAFLVPGAAGFFGLTFLGEVAFFGLVVPFLGDAFLGLVAFFFVSGAAAFCFLPAPGAFLGSAVGGGTVVASAAAASGSFLVEAALPLAAPVAFPVAFLGLVAAFFVPGAFLGLDFDEAAALPFLAGLAFSLGSSSVSIFSTVGSTFLGAAFFGEAAFLALAFLGEVAGFLVGFLPVPR
jgi:hypothetical protein